MPRWKGSGDQRKKGETGGDVGLTEDVGEDVIADHERGGDPEPDKAFEDVVDDEVTTINRGFFRICK